MKKKYLSLLAIIISVLAVITSCASKSFDEAATENLYQFYDTVAEEAERAPNGGFSDYKAETATSSGSITYSSVTTNDSITADRVDRKIIYTSSYNIQTTEFENAISSLAALCQKYGAYYESSETYGTKENADRNGSFVVRVPVQNYNAFKSEAGSIGVVIRSSENNRDVTEVYVDTEARLQSAKVREERLLEILANADSLDDVLLLEKELADVRYEIESMSGSLRKYDSLINYS
ncbi:MAG: DUF4349 domain-containing protein, partial [Clostridia bacterium]|nr:DUF4349 domain-containing protein [Clostridia bacterium]